MSPHEMLKNEAVSMISAVTKMEEGKIRPLLETPPQPGMGDLSLPCFRLAAELKKDPKRIAEEIAMWLKPGEMIGEIKAMGPYVNFFANWKKLSQIVIDSVLKDKDYGSGERKNENIMVEYSSPNTNKPLHLGHLRNDSIGMAVSNILEKAGYNVIKAILLSDRGIHICKSMIAYKKWGHNKKPNKKPDHFVGDFYVLFEKKRTLELEKELSDMLKKWEEGDKEIRTLWKKMDSWAVAGFLETYKRFGSKFDIIFRESEFYDKAKPIIEAGLKKVFSKDRNGSIVANLEKYGLGKKVILRADGTSIYITNDLALTKHKFDKYRLDKSIWIVGSEQNLYFQQLFKIFELLGYEWAKNCFHLSYGMVYLPEGKMKSREGTVVDADDIINDVVNLSEAETKKRKTVPKKDIAKISEIIGLGAIKYFLLKTDTVKDIYFNPRESISLEGNTAPYIQYTYARMCSIFKKGNVVKISKYNASVLKDPKEKALIKTLMNFPAVVSDAARDLKPHYIVNYTYRLATEFNDFYESLPVLKAAPDERKARLALVKAVQTVLKSALALLGIGVVEQM